MSGDKRGRSSKLTPERLSKIIEQIKFGVPAHRAAISTGITERCHFNWLKRGKECLSKFEHDMDAIPENDDDYIFAYYASQVEQAYAEAESRLVLIISKEATKTWQAAAWMLERTRPESYGRRDKLDANVNANVTTTYTDSVQEAWKRRQERSEKADVDGAGTDV